MMKPKSPDDLVSKYAKPLEEETFNIYLPDGEAIVCKVPDRLGFIEDFKAEMAKFWKLVSSERVPDAWKEFLPLTWEEAVGVVGLYYNSVEPTKFNQYQALQMTKAGGGYVLNSLINQIETHHQSIGYNQFVSKVEEEKKDLSPMTSEDGNSELPPESTESIVTN
jgi:hypothetical protein